MESEIVFIANANIAHMLHQKYPYGMNREAVLAETSQGNGCIAALSHEGKQLYNLMFIAHVIKQRPYSHRRKWLCLRRLGVDYRPSTQGIQKPVHQVRVDRNKKKTMDPDFIMLGHGHYY